MITAMLLAFACQNAGLALRVAGKVHPAEPNPAVAVARVLVVGLLTGLLAFLSVVLVALAAIINVWGG